MKKVSAVDWLSEQYYYSDGKLTRQDFEQAKEMGKKQIIDAYCDGRLSVINKNIISAEQYYNEDFKQQ
jgi:hypothetical protein